MQHNALGKTGLQVSALSFGASSLGGVFHEIDEGEAIATVGAVLEVGINYIDVAPAYGGTRAETVLGRALKGVDRRSFILSTKVGKHTDPHNYGSDRFDYSRDGIMASIDDSSRRLGVETLDIVHLHDIEYQEGRHIEWALDEGLATLRELKTQGRIKHIGCGIYPVDLWHRVLTETDIDAALIHNHFCLNDTRLSDLLPYARQAGIGVINASPFATGLLTERGAASWHPATPEQRAVFRNAARYCSEQGTSINKLAFQFSSQRSDADTTMFSTANRKSLQNCLDWFGEPVDDNLVAEVQSILSPVMNIDWVWP